MSFHPLARRPRTWGEPAKRRVVARVHANSANGQRRAVVTISGDLIAHLQARPGDSVRVLIGFGEDAGDFAIERTKDMREGKKLTFPSHSRTATFTVKAEDFVKLTPGFATVFDIEIAPGRIVCRSPAALMQAAE